MIPSPEPSTRSGASADLPVRALAPQIIEALGRSGRLVLVAPTGSGKSTQVPQILIDAGAGGRQVLVLQPRRLAARLLALRVAAERGSKPGGEVGFQVRFEDVSSAATRILFVTEAILMRRLVRDPTLEGVGTVILDEFHERHLHGDIGLGQMLDLQETLRKDLKLVVMSATLDPGPLAAFLAPCETVESAGRAHPVEVRHLSRAPRPGKDGPWDMAVEQVQRAVAEGWSGNALVFMPGAWEIGRTLRALESAGLSRDFEILPLHGELSLDRQQAAVTGGPGRRIVVATNVAETSLTIEGVNLVVDSGLARVPRYDPHRGINTLLVEKISRASSDQRAGRAGRTGPGRCVRLWTEEDHRTRPAFELPEIRRVDLSEAILALKACGVADAARFRWFESPSAAALERGEALLRDLGAANPESGVITPLGRRMQSFPTHPRYARMLLAGAQLGCVRTAALIAALTSGRSLLVRRPGVVAEERRAEVTGSAATSDFLPLIAAWEHARAARFDRGECERLGIHGQAAREISAVFEQFLAIARREDLPDDRGDAPPEALEECLLAGFADHLAVRRDAGTLRCDVIHQRRGTLDRDSVVRNSPLFVAAEIREIEAGRGEVDVRLGLATAVSPASLESVYPEALGWRTEVAYDPIQRRVVARQMRMFRDLVIERGPERPPPFEEAARLLADEVLAGRCSFKEWDESVDQWIVRLNCLARWMPELALSPIGPEERRHLVEQACHGAASCKELRDRPVWPVVRAWLGGDRHTLVDRLVPDRVVLASGKRGRVRYAADAPPVLSARIQDLFGTASVPALCGGRVVPAVEILAPNFRPVQTTQDLAGFWRDTYPKLRQELQRRYPRHEWR